MNIIDIIIILFLILGAYIGFKQGFTKSLVSFLGILFVAIIAYFLKNPVSEFLMSFCPFFNFGGIIKGVTVLNIAVYEIIAFILVFSILIIALKALLLATGILETILKFTIILGIPSKILGAIVGAIEGYIIAFIVVFILNQPMLDVGIMEGSKLKDNILDTPVLNEVISSVDDTVTDIYHLIEDNRYENDPDGFNREAIDIMLEHKMITVKYVEKLVDHGKIRVPGIDSILNKYR